MRKYVVLASAAACFGAFGVDVKWSNSGTGSWNTPSNWQGDALPGADDAAINDAGGTILVSDGVTAAARILRTGTESGKGGHLLITGGSLTLPSIASQIGSVAGGSGTVEMTGGELYVGQFQVGAYGTGSMILSGGTVYSKDWCCIGRYPGGVGTLTVAGSGVWECQRLSVFASEQGTGTITIENGGELRFAATNIREFVIGNQSSGVGVLRLNTGGTLKVAGVDVRYATDTFILDGGALVCMDTGSHANFIRTSGGGGKFQIGPNGGTIDTSTGTQTVALDIDDLPGASGGPLVKKGAGTLVLSSAGSFSGGFVVEEGTLSVSSALNLPNGQTAPITVKSGATLALGSGWMADEAAALQARITVEEGGHVTYAGESTGDYVVNVAGTMTLASPISLTRRLVKTGAGNLILADGNTFAGGVAVSNGTLTADYAASGLADTHLTVAGGGAGAPAYFGAKGASFTPVLAASGDGTVSFEKFAGIKGVDDDLTIDFFGDGRAVKRGAAGFAITDILILPAPGHSATLVNMIDGNGGNWTLKGSGNGPLYWTGGFTNTASANSTTYYWTGDLILPGRPDGIPFRTFIFQVRSGNVLFTNATVNMKSDLFTGNGDGLAKVTLKDCTKTADGGWDYVNGYTGTVLTVDGGSYQASRLNVGYTTAGRTGRLVITNDAAVRVTGGEGLYMYSGWGDQYSGSMTVTKASYIGYDSLASAGRGPATYTLHDGTYTANGNFIVGNGTGSDGTFNLSGGTLTLNAWSGIGNVTGSVGRVNISGGRIVDNASCQIGNNTGSVGRVVMSGGSWFFKDGCIIQIGACGDGRLIQTGGDISAASYPCVGRYPGSAGEYLLHGGTFTHRIPANNQNYLFFVAEEGTGTVSIANGGRLTVTNANGVCIARASASKGTLLLSPGGTFEATTAYGGSGDDTFVFNGGTFKMLSNAKASTVIQSSVNRRVATPLGGAIDTAGKGDFTLPVALTAAARAEELAETITHRWRFDDGSLADCVGDSDATVGGTVYWTDGAVRLLGTANGTSCINLGADVLPAGGRGATIEMWVTQRERRSWARIVCAGPSATFWLSSNRGGASKEGWLSISGSSGAYSHQGYELENGKTYHMAVVFDQQPDDTWRFTVSLRDATTGELIDASSSTANASWSFDKIVQSGGIWLGRSAAAADPDPYMDYHDVRIYNRAMTADQLSASCAAGPDAHFYLMKKGAGMLTLTGANTYKAGTGVDGGTLTLASGATLPATEMWAGAGATLQLNATAQTARELGGNGTVKGGTLAVTGTIQPGGRHAIGTLTVNGTALTSGTLVIDLAADGTSDRLAATGALDLSNLSLKLGDANLNEDKSYTLVTAAEITGKFRDEELPNRWRTFVQPTKVTIAYANGTVMLLR